MSTKWPGGPRWVPLAAVLVSACGGVARDRYASTVESFARAPTADSRAPYADPTRALGPPDQRSVALGTGAVLVLRFDRAVPDGPGPDLRVYKLGTDDSRAVVAASADGRSFTELAARAAGTQSDFDLQDLGLPQAVLVRVLGVDDLGSDPGFDLDAVQALH